MTQTTSKLCTKLTSAAASIAVATTFTFSFPQQSDAFQGFFGFSTEACEARVAQQMAPTFIENPWFVYVSIAAIGAYFAAVEELANSVCEESDKEKASDQAIWAAWAYCVNALGSNDSKSKLGLSRAGSLGPTTTGEKMWPYDRFTRKNKVKRNYKADYVLEAATDGLARFVGSTDAPSRVLNAGQIEAMLRRCGVPES